MKKNYFLMVVAIICCNAIFAQNCPSSDPNAAVAFNWSTSPGTGNEMGGFASHGNQSKVFATNGMNVTVNILDPNNKLTTAAYKTETGSAALGVDIHSNVYTQTNGAYGNGYLTLGMFSETSSETVTLEYLFSVPVYLCNLEISDIDYNGLGSDVPNYVSYQDKVVVSAFSGATNVPVSIVPADAADKAYTISGQTITSDFTLGVFGDNPSSANSGKVLVSNPNQPINRLVITYSDGPNDDGRSNDHAIRIGNVVATKVSTQSLPVNIVDFIAKANNGKVNASLVISNQDNVASYELQKSNSTTQWTSVATARAIATTSYNFTDALPFNGANFYRVKISDKNGAISYSTIKRVDIATKESYALQFSDNLYLIKANSTSNKKVTIAIVNATGKLVQTKEYQINNGYSAINLDGMQNQSTGLYFVNVYENGAKVFTGKMVK